MKQFSVIGSFVKTAFILFILCFTGPAMRAGDKHDLHLSMCELRFNEASSSFEVAIKIFVDDLELAIEKEGVKDLRMGSPDENQFTDMHIAEYLNKFFSIEIDGVRLKADFIGKEYTDDKLAVWCYIEYAGKDNNARKCILSNRILLDIYQDQRNIMDIRMSKSHKDYTILDGGNDTWSFSY